MTIHLQLLIAINAVVALLAGAAHDDKLAEWGKANFDSLTGLANHRHLIDRLGLEMARSERTGKSFGLIYLDLDGFKQVNDTLGHQAGDELLKHIAAGIQGAIRKTDLAARLGGDEFAIVLPEAGDPQKAQRLAQTLLQTLADSAPLKAGDAHVTASLGIAFFPDHGRSAVSLMQAADRAMYQAKAQGKNRYVVSSSAITQTRQALDQA